MTVEKTIGERLDELKGAPRILWLNKWLKWIRSLTPPGADPAEVWGYPLLSPEDAEKILEEFCLDLVEVECLEALRRRALGVEEAKKPRAYEDPRLMEKYDFEARVMDTANRILELERVQVSDPSTAWNILELWRKGDIDGIIMEVEGMLREYYYLPEEEIKDELEKLRARLEKKLEKREPVDWRLVLKPARPPEELIKPRPPRKEVKPPPAKPPIKPLELPPPKPAPPRRTLTELKVQFEALYRDCRKHIDSYVTMLATRGKYSPQDFTLERIRERITPRTIKFSESKIFNKYKLTDPIELYIAMKTGRFEALVREEYPDFRLTPVCHPELMVFDQNTTMFYVDEPVLCLFAVELYTPRYPPYLPVELARRAIECNQPVLWVRVSGNEWIVYWS